MSKQTIAHPLAPLSALPAQRWSGPSPPVARWRTSALPPPAASVPQVPLECLSPLSPEAENPLLI